MAYKHESDMYGPVLHWFGRFLTEQHRRAQVQVFDSSRKSLSRLIEENGLIQNLPAEWPSWDIHVDVVGFILTRKKTNLAFVECKNSAITLAQVSQLLGYSRVALLIYSFITAPQGASDSLRSLLLTHSRLDVLHYSRTPGSISRSIAVARWDEHAQCIDHGTVIAADSAYLGQL